MLEFKSFVFFVLCVLYIGSRFTATLPASMDDNDLSGPQMLPTDKMVESQHGETNSKGIKLKSTGHVYSEDCNCMLSHMGYLKL